jgi:hypothetical protein
LLAAAQTHHAGTGEHAMLAPHVLQYFRDDTVRFRNLRLWSRRRWLHRWKFDCLDYDFVLTSPRSPASSGNYLFHRSIYEASGGYAEDCGAYDAWVFGVRNYLAGYRFVTVSGTSYWHRLHDLSYWTSQERAGRDHTFLLRALETLRCAYDRESIINASRVHIGKEVWPLLRVRTDAPGRKAL